MDTLRSSAAYFQPVDARQHEVEDHGVGQSVADGTQGGFAILSRDDFVPFKDEAPAQHREILRSSSTTRMVSLMEFCSPH